MSAQQHDDDLPDRDYFVRDMEEAIEMERENYEHTPEGWSEERECSKRKYDLLQEVWSAIRDYFLDDDDDDITFTPSQRVTACACHIWTYKVLYKGKKILKKYRQYSDSRFPECCSVGESAWIKTYPEELKRFIAEKNRPAS